MNQIVTTPGKPDSRLFHLGDVLSVMTGRLLSPQGMAGLYGILTFMSGEAVYTHQLPRVCDECKPFLQEQFPELTHVVVEDISPDNFQERLNGLVALYGEWFAVPVLPPGQHVQKHPVEEAMEIWGPDRVGVLDVTSEPGPTLH